MAQNTRNDRARSVALISELKEICAQGREHLRGAPGAETVEAVCAQTDILLERLEEALESASAWMLEAHDKAERNQELEEIIALSPVLTFSLARTSQWPVAYLSSSISRFGYDPDDFLSGERSFLSIIHPEDLERLTAEAERCAQEQACREFTQECRIFGADGELHYLEGHVFAQRDKTGRLTHFRGTAQDISERKRMELELARQKEVTRTLLDTATDAAMLLDTEGRVLFFTGRSEEFLGYTEAEALGRVVFELMSPEDSLRRRVLFDKALKELRSISFQDKAEGMEMEVTIHPIEGTDGGVHQVAVYARDVTPLRQAERALTETERRYADLFHNASDAILVHDSGKRLIEVNDVALRILGYTREELLALPPQAISMPEERATQKERMRRIHEQGSLVFEKRFLRKDGFALPCEVSARSITLDGKPAVLSVVRDISERVRSRELLLKAQARIRQMLASSPAVIYTADPMPGRDVLAISHITDNVRARLGYAPNEVAAYQDFWTERVHPEDLETFRDGLARLIKDREQGLEYRLRDASGSYRYLRDDRRLICDRQGKPMEIVGSIVDVTELKAAQEVLRISRDSIQALLDLTQMEGASNRELAAFVVERGQALTGSGEGFLILRPAEETGEDSPRFPTPLETYSIATSANCRLLEELGGERAHTPQGRPDAHNPTDHFDLLLDKTTPTMVNTGVSLNAPPGHVELSRYLIVPLLDGGQVICVLGVGNKATDYDGEDVKQLTLLLDGMWRHIQRERAAREVLAAKEAAEISDRAKTSFLAAMSHELRTPIHHINGLADLLDLAELPEDDREHVELIKGAVSSLAHIVDEVLEFSAITSGKAKLSRLPFEIPALLESLVGRARRQAAGKGLSFRHEIGPGVPRVLLGDPQKLAKILEILVDNAVKFTQSGGVALRVRHKGNILSGNQPSQLGDDEILADLPRPEGAADTPGGKGYRRRALLLFDCEDTGIGVDDAVRETIFDSFTQPVDVFRRHYQGTGLGLALARKLVELMDGTIWVENASGGGSIFSFTALFDIPEK